MSKYSMGSSVAESKQTSVPPSLTNWRRRSTPSLPMPPAYSGGPLPRSWPYSTPTGPPGLLDGLEPRFERSQSRDRANSHGEGKRPAGDIVGRFGRTAWRELLVGMVLRHRQNRQIGTEGLRG